MLQFLKDSVREMKHVVWPTKQETIQYFKIVVIMLVVFGLYLTIFNTIFTEVLFFLKDTIQNFLAS